MTRPLISIVILNYNGLSDTIECISSIFTTQKNIKFEVIVVDNGSKNDERLVLRQKFNNQIKVFRLSKNLGFTGGNNWAVGKTSGKYILINSYNHHVLLLIECHELLFFVGQYLLHEE